MSVETPSIPFTPPKRPDGPLDPALLTPPGVEPERATVGIRLTADYIPLLDQLPTSDSKKEQILKAIHLLKEVFLCTENSTAQIKHFVGDLLKNRPMVEKGWEKVLTPAFEQAVKVAAPADLASLMERFYLSFVMGSGDAKLHNTFQKVCEKLSPQQLRVIQPQLAGDATLAQTIQGALNAAERKELDLKGPRLGVVERVRNRVTRLMEGVGWATGFREKLVSVFGSKANDLAL